MKKYYGHIAIIVVALIIAFSCYKYGINQAETKIEYKEVKASQKQIDSLKATLKPIEQKVEEFKERKVKAKEAEKSITYPKEECKEIVENLKEQIANCDSIVIYQDKIIYVDREIIKKQDFVIDKMIIPKKCPWGIGVQIGYGTNGKELQQYVGFGISYNFIRF